MKKIVNKPSRKSPKKSFAIKAFLPLFIFGLLIIPVMVVMGLRNQNLFSQAAGTPVYTAGVTTIGSTMDSGNANGISSTRVTTGAFPGLLNTISVYIGTVQASPKNHMQVAIYADNGNNAPGILLGSSSSVVLKAKSWNTFTMPSTGINASTKYWLGFNADGSKTQYAIASRSNTNSAWKIPTTYGTWPNPLGNLSDTSTEQYSIYMTYSGLPTPTAIPTIAPPTIPPTVVVSSGPTPSPIPSPTAIPTVAPTSTPTGPSTAEYPRLGGMLIGSPQNYDQTSYQQQIAKLDLAVLGMYNGWNKNGKTPAQAVGQIKALNPNILLSNYTLMTEVNNSSSDTATAPLRAKLNAEKGPNGIGNWWGYNAAGQHTDWSNGAYGSWDTNLTLLTTPDANGDHWTQWLAKNDYDTLYRGKGFDFWYSDNNMWKPRADVDWNRDGTNDSQNSAQAQNWWRDGERAYYDSAKSVAPGMMMMVNADNDLDGSVYPDEATPFTQFKNEVGSAFIEHAMGKSWSAETWGGWAMTMGWYRQLKSNLIAPQIVLFDIYLPSTTDYQFLRYGFASALMDDGYFSASTDYNKVVWYDEYDLAGTASTKWLGKAIDGPQTAAWQKGVYRRNFEHGTVLINPKGNGKQTVTLEAGYRHFLGKQAPTINNGQAVTTVTLNDRDGLFLVKN